MEEINTILDSENQTNRTVVFMIGKDYRVINEFNNKFVLLRTALVLDDKTKHLPTRYIYSGKQIMTISYSINLYFN